MTHQQIASGSIPDGPSNCFPFQGHPGHLAEASPETGNQLVTRHVRQLVNAGAYAASIGSPFTAHVTLHLRLAECFSPETWAAYQTDLLEKMSRWLTRNGISVAFAWVRENGPVKGEHLHLLLHLPQPMWGAFKRFMLKAGGFTPADASGEAIRISGGRFGMYAETMRAGAARYILKSLSPTTCNALGIRHKPTLPVPVKRCGASDTIGPKARKAAGWVELRSLPELHAHLNPAAANDNHAEESSDAA
jgi:hypothetical protein